MQEVGSLCTDSRVSSVVVNKVSKLEVNVPFQCKYGYIRDERSGVESNPYPVKEGQQYINLTLAAFLFSSHPKRERDQDAKETRVECESHLLK